MDDRYDKSDIVTHNGGKIPAVTVRDAEDIYKHLAESDEVYDVVAVDEAFLIEGVCDVLRWLYSKGVTIVVSTLDLSAACNPLSLIHI